MINNNQRFQGKGNSSYSGFDELLDNEKYLLNYNKDIVSLFGAALSPAVDVLEFGAGLGTLAQLWFERTGMKPECLEIDPRLQQIIMDRGFVCHKNFDSIEKKKSAIYTSNVLEHIEDDVSVLQKMYDVLDDGEKIAIYVPAFMSIYSDLDAHVGHFRRYSKREIIDKLRLCGFEIVKCHYVDVVGFFAWAYIKCRGYKPREKNQSKRHLVFYDRILYPLSRFFDRIGMRCLFGKNIFVVAKKPTLY